MVKMIQTERRIRICHVCSGHPADDGRIFERACVSLAEENYEVHLLARSPEPDSFVLQGVTIHPLQDPQSRWKRLLRRGQIARMASALEADVYHVHEPELLGPVLYHCRNKKVIWDVHEPYLENVAYKPWIPRIARGPIRWLWDTREHALVRRCAAVVTATKWLAPRYQTMHDNVVIAANFPKLSEPLNPIPENRRWNAGVFTGTISESRGLLNVLRAIALLKEKECYISLDVAGRSITPAYLNFLMDEVNRLGIGDRVRYHGVLSKEKAIQLQLGCGIGISPSLPSPGIDFGYPVKMFEFMAAGLPVVYSDLPSFRTVAEDYEIGIAVDPFQVEQIADAMERLAGNPELAVWMGKEGQRAIRERFNWDIEWIKLRDLYRDILLLP